MAITDQNMPHLTGAQLVQTLLEIRSDTPTILCTGYSGTGDEEQVRKIGIRAFVMKPFYSGELLTVIGEVLGR